MKRFWQHARAKPDAGEHVIVLDGKPVRLPGGATLRVRGRVLAEAVAAEWAQAGDEFSLDQLRLTQLASTVQERIAPQPEPVAGALARYAESDLLCYRAERPLALRQRQSALWQPWLDWAADRHGGHLAVTSGVVHAPQPVSVLATLAAAVAAHPPPVLAGLGVLVPAYGSLVLALAVVEDALDPTEAYELSILEERFQAEQWGDDAEAAARRQAVAADVAAAARFVALARA